MLFVAGKVFFYSGNVTYLTSLLILFAMMVTLKPFYNRPEMIAKFSSNMELRHG